MSIASCCKKNKRNGKFELGTEIEKDVFRLVKSVGQRKDFKCPRGIEPQPFRFRDPMLQYSICGSVVEHWSAESEGLRFDSSRELRIFFSSHAREKTKRSFLFLYRAQTYHPSNSNLIIQKKIIVCMGARRYTQNFSWSFLMFDCLCTCNFPVDCLGTIVNS